ncbi:MAG TPA: IS91 family transposase [Candidatus Hydrogenedentes bacterium]|nr:IS91 family transposase [Candidatus Hydrogenedentota bacterium]
MGKPHLEVADVFRAYGEDYRRQHALSMSIGQRRGMRAIELCRTAALGGHVDRCDHCGHEVISYNSCRNRHCPKCQNLDKALWREARQNEVLPVPYYHVVFTLPAPLAPVALQNKRLVYELLFRAVSRTLLRIGADPRHLGAQLGFVAVLHTWGQTLHHHPHIHCVVPGGGLTPDAKRWIACKKGFFLPVRVLSRLFRRLFLAALEQAFRHGQLEFHGAIQPLAQPEHFAKLLQTCQKTEWVVYAKPPFSGPEAVLDYLARYTHRIAISNHRLIRMENDQVSFSYKDYKTGNYNQTLSLDAHEFIRRFLLHVLPAGFQRVRYYGFMANCLRTQKLDFCRRLLHAEQENQLPSNESRDRLSLFQSLTGVDPFQCPRCRQGRLVRSHNLAPAPTPCSPRAHRARSP